MQRTWRQAAAEPVGLSRPQSLQIVEISPPLRDPALVACLVLAAHQHVGAARALGGAIDIHLALADRVLDVPPIGLAGLEAPDLLVGTLQEAGQALAVAAAAGQCGA